MLTPHSSICLHLGSGNFKRIPSWKISNKFPSTVICDRKQNKLDFLQKSAPAENNKPCRLIIFFADITAFSEIN